MKVVTVVGARPQFIKAAVVSHVLKKKHTDFFTENVEGHKGKNSY